MSKLMKIACSLCLTFNECN